MVNKTPEQLRNLKSRVNTPVAEEIKNIMLKVEEAKENDKLLFALYCNSKNIHGASNYWENMDGNVLKGVKSFKYIERLRRAIQEAVKYGILPEIYRANNETKKLRDMLEKEFRTMYGG